MKTKSALFECQKCGGRQRSADGIPFRCKQCDGLNQMKLVDERKGEGHGTPKKEV